MEVQQVSSIVLEIKTRGSTFPFLACNWNGLLVMLYGEGGDGEEAQVTLLLFAGNTLMAMSFLRTHKMKWHI